MAGTVDLTVTVDRYFHSVSVTDDLEKLDIDTVPIEVLYDLFVSKGRLPSSWYRGSGSVKKTLPLSPTDAAELREYAKKNEGKRKNI
jgi:hypothetical protein